MEDVNTEVHPKSWQEKISGLTFTHHAGSSNHTNDTANTQDQYATSQEKDLFKRKFKPLVLSTKIIYSLDVIWLIMKIITALS